MNITFENTRNEVLVFIDGEQQATIQKLRFRETNRAIALRDSRGPVWAYDVVIGNNGLLGRSGGGGSRRLFGPFIYEDAYKPTLAELRSALNAAKAWVTRLARERAQAEAEEEAHWNSLDESARQQ